MESLQHYPHDHAAFGQARASTEILEWFAVFTAPRHEKVVARHFEVRGIEGFLPLYRSVHQWKNRQKVAVQLPLFPSYVFARIHRRARHKVLQVPGVITIVGTGSEPTPLPDSEITSLRTCLTKYDFEPHPYLKVGQRVRVVDGAMAGLEGLLVRKKNACRFVLTLDLIRQSAAVEVEAMNLEPVRGHC